MDKRRGNAKVIGINPADLHDIREFGKDYSSKEKRQRELWDRYLSEHKGLGTEFLRTNDLQLLVYDGVPDMYRGTHAFSQKISMNNASSQG